MEQLEGRAVPAYLTAATPQQLVDAINLSNGNTEPDTIDLAQNMTFTLTSALPAIQTGNDLTIRGYGDVIQRDTGPKTPNFGFFAVKAGASLALRSLTLQGGTSGAIVNIGGTLNLAGVTLQNNAATGAGGAIYSTKATNINGEIIALPSLVMANCIVRNNHVQVQSPKFQYVGTNGESGKGGGVYVDAGTADLTNVTFTGNTVQGGDGAKGGWTYDPWRGKYYAPAGVGGEGRGGGMYVVGATVSLHGCTFMSNQAVGGMSGSGGYRSNGVGGGLYIVDPPTHPETVACLDTYTVAVNNIADIDPNIHGPYTVCR